MIFLKHKYLRLAACVALPLILGGISALAVRGGMEEYAMLEQPPLSPPGWLFPVAWSLLYVLMGAASYLVLSSAAPLYERRRALKLYAVQLVVNVLWPPIFFGLGLYLAALLWLALLWALALITALRFRRVSRPAAYLLAPYIVWLTFAAYLNLGVWLLN